MQGLPGKGRLLLSGYVLGENMSDITKVALDAMGGDNAPVEVIKGAVDAVNLNKNIVVYLTGTKEAVDNELSKYSYPSDRIIPVYST